MARHVTRTWYRIAISRASEKLLVAAEGEHLGAAIAAAEKHTGGRAIAVERATDTVPLGESVGKQHVVALPDDVSATPAFHWPRGVLPKLGHPVDIKTGFTIHPDPKLLVVEAQTDAEQLTDTFLGVLERLPSADNLEVRVLDHFENAPQTDVWLTSRVDGRRIIGFLDDHDLDLIENGHVELSIYIRKHKATLRLTEHKTVVWLSEGEDLRPDVLRWMGEFKLAPIDPFVTVASVPHFHYRPAKSRDRQKLGEQLYRQRLRRVDRLTVPPRDPARDTEG